MKKLTIFFIVVDILVAGCFFLFYGPFETFRNTIITTAIATKTHDYIAYTFYSEKKVSEVINLNSYIPLTDDVNLDDIIIDTKPRDSYDNEYDEAILTRDEGNDLYKYLKIKVGGYDAHLVAIYDPSKVILMTCAKFNTINRSGKERVSSMAKRYNAVIGINGGGFSDPDGYGSDIPLGYVIKDGKIIWSTSNNKQPLIGFTNDNKLLLVNATGEDALKMGMRDAVQFGPFLIVNGETIKYKSTVGGYDRAARTAIAQRKDGIVLFLVTEGTHSRGPNMSEVAETLKKYGAYNAANMDGGTSVQMVIKNKLINKPKNVYGQTVSGGRMVVTAWGVTE